MSRLSVEYAKNVIQKIVSLIDYGENLNIKIIDDAMPIIRQAVHDLEKEVKNFEKSVLTMSKLYTNEILKKDKEIERLRNDCKNY